jgi:uncharacterized membrane protein YkvA (DUF1232 family)
MKMLARAAEWGRRVKRDAFALWLAARDPRVPWYAKLLAGAVAAYALSPIDLIPDFVPILGYVDDLIIVPAGIVLATRLIPDALMAEFRAAAAKRERERVSLVGAAVVVAIWVAALVVVAWWLARHGWVNGRTS